MVCGVEADRLVIRDLAGHEGETVILGVSQKPEVPEAREEQAEWCR